MVAVINDRGNIGDYIYLRIDTIKAVGMKKLRSHQIMLTKLHVSSCALENMRSDTRLGIKILFFVRD